MAALVSDHQAVGPVARQLLGVAAGRVARRRARLDRLPAPEAGETAVGGLLEIGQPERTMIAHRDQPAAVRRQPEPGQAAEAGVRGPEHETSLEAQRPEHGLVGGRVAELDPARLDHGRSGRPGGRGTTGERDHGRGQQGEHSPIALPGPGLERARTRAPPPGTAGAPTMVARGGRHAATTSFHPGRWRHGPGTVRGRARRAGRRDPGRAATRPTRRSPGQARPRS